MDTICLRRTKTDRKPDGSLLVTLPNKKILTRKVAMSEEEKLCYGIYSKGAREIVDRYQHAGNLMKNFAHIFAMMTRMRQLCCHREIIKEVDWEEALRDKAGLARKLKGFLNNEDINDKENSNDTDQEKRLMMQLRDLIRSGVSDDCSVCMDDLSSAVITPCAHVFCRACIERVIDTLKPPTCPLCRSKLKNKKELLEAAPDEDDNEEDATLADMEDIHVNVSSSKVNAVLKELLRIQRDMPEDKIIIVSQFTSFLSILQPLLAEHKFSLCRLDGSMPHYARAEAVHQFQSSQADSPQVLLLSLKAGGVGLNLTAANHLLLLDPAWNPASEWQCFDRTHRLGQKKDVYIYKYIVKDSIEEKMLDIQAKKKGLISGAFHMPADDRRMQRVDDIRNIFGV
jgi:SWI/SNF-related matrix-associated actin-dependent regulator of chromatin subfamily A3